MKDERPRILFRPEMEPAVDEAAGQLAEAGEDQVHAFILARNRIALGHYARTKYQKGYVFSLESKRTKSLIDQMGEAIARAKDIMRIEGTDTESEL